MKKRTKHVIKDISVVLTFAVFIAAVGIFAKHEFAFLFGGGSTEGGDTSPSQAVQSEAIVIPDASVPLAAPSIIPATPTPAVTEPPQPTEAPPPLSIPLQLTVPAIGIAQQPITEYTDEMLAKEGDINPDGWFTISWWSGGGRPGASWDNSPTLTTFLYGHATNRPDKKVIFDDIDLLSAGDEVQIETDHGTFTYAIETVFTLPKSEMPTDPRTCQNSAGRLLLVSCWSASPRAGASARDNVVAVAWQTSAPPPAAEAAKNPPA